VSALNTIVKNSLVIEGNANQFGLVLIFCKNCCSVWWL